MELLRARIEIHDKWIIWRRRQIARAAESAHERGQPLLTVHHPQSSPAFDAEDRDRANVHIASGCGRAAQKK
jgi:hypothetical protein